MCTCCKKSEAGIDAVNGMIGGSEFMVEVIPAGSDSFVCIKSNGHLLVVFQEMLHLVKTQPGSVKGQVIVTHMRKQSRKVENLCVSSRSFLLCGYEKAVYYPVIIESKLCMLNPLRF